MLIIGNFSLESLNRVIITRETTQGLRRGSIKVGYKYQKIIQTLHKTRTEVVVVGQWCWITLSSGTLY